VFDGRTTSTYEITTSLPKPKLTLEQNARYAEINTYENKEILENFNVAAFFKRALNLEEAADGEMEKDVSYTLYIAESKRHECPKLKIIIGGEEVSALLDTGCKLSILNEQLYDKLRLLGLNCLELPTQHLSLVSAFNEKSKRIKKQALLEIQIGDSAVDQIVLLSPQLLTDAILGLDFLVDHAAEISFPNRTVSLEINEKFCRLEFQVAREVTSQEVAEASVKNQVRNFALRSTLPCATAYQSADSDIGQQRHLESTAAVTGDKLGEVSDDEAHIDIPQGDCLLSDDGSPHCEDACDNTDFPATHDVHSRKVKRGCYDALGRNKEGQVADNIHDSTCVRGMLDSLNNYDDSAGEAKLCLHTSYFEPNYVKTSQKSEAKVNSLDDTMITADQLRAKVC
jgi:hypothetical protein